MPREHFSEDPADSVHFHCARCRRVFKDLRSRRWHVRKADCSPLATPTTVQLTSTHPGQGQQQHLTMNFDNLGQAEQWFLEQDLERTFTKKSTCDPSRTYVCRQAWNRDSAKRKKTKKLYECPARITFRGITICQCVKPQLQSERCSNCNRYLQVVANLKHSHTVIISEEGPTQMTQSYLNQEPSSSALSNESSVLDRASSNERCQFNPELVEVETKNRAILIPESTPLKADDSLEKMDIVSESGSSQSVSFLEDEMTSVRTYETEKNVEVGFLFELIEIERQIRSKFRKSRQVLISESITNTRKRAFINSIKKLGIERAIFPEMKRS